MMGPTLFTREPSDDDFVYYRYTPSLAAAALFTSLFALATALHVFQMIRAKTWFMIPFVVGGLLEMGGYAGRIIAATEAPGPYELDPYIIQAVLLLVAPTLFAASVYMELGRIVMMTDGESALFIRRTWLTKIFVTSDVVAFGIQSAGAAILSNGGESADTGKWIIIVGLIAQLLSFGCFVVAASLFHWRMRKMPSQLARERPWTKHMIGLYIVGMLILIRSLVRVVEYFQGNAGTIMSNQVYLYIFDASLMFLAVVTMNAIHPGEVARYVREMKGGQSSKYERTASRESGGNNMEMA